MILSATQMASFHRIRNALATFAITEGATGGSWLSPDFVDRFVVTNPADLDTDELAIASRWRDGAHGPFFVMRHTPSCTIFMNELGNFAVRGTAYELGTLVPETPTLVDATLVPFGGLIVCASNPRFDADDLGRASRADIDATYRSLADKGVVYSANMMTRIVRQARNERQAPQTVAAKLAAAMRELEAMQLMPLVRQGATNVTDGGSAQVITFRPNAAAELVCS